jgi:hypothetical protein
MASLVRRPYTLVLMVPVTIVRTAHAIRRTDTVLVPKTRRRDVRTSISFEGGTDARACTADRAAYRVVNKVVAACNLAGRAHGASIS